MPEKTFVDLDYSLAAIKFKGNWRFFFDNDWAFLLDYSSYDDSYNPSQGEFRYGTMIVDENNAELWMDSLFREVSLKQVPRLYLQGTERKMKLTFLIDFDEKLWVGCLWNMDQSPLQIYQPEGWNALEDKVLDYLPPNLKGYFV